MILAAIESNTAAVVLTNNIIPSSNIISKAYERSTPLLLVPQDTYHTITQINAIEPLLTRDDHPKIEVIDRVVQKNVDLGFLIG
jgi:hypothetical protein